MHMLREGLARLATIERSQLELVRGQRRIERELGLLIELVGKPPASATRAVLTLSHEEPGMSGQITVDTTDETVKLVFVDDKGDTDAAQPLGAVVAFTSDNEAVATVAVIQGDETDGVATHTGQITPVGEGVANISATISNVDGTPFLEADGATPFPAPAPVQVTVSAGAAVGDELTLSA